MALEVDLNTLLKTLCPRVYPDVGPEPLPMRPYVTWQQAGGEAITFLDRTLPGKRNARVQINVWADTRLSANALAMQIEDALRLSQAFQAAPLAALIADYELELKLYGTIQDFSIFS